MVQFGFTRSIVLLLPWCIGLAYFSTRLHYSLPTPQVEQYSSDGTPQFSESKCMEYINHLSTYPDGSPRYRIVGTEEMLESEIYLMKEIEKIKQDVIAKMPAALHEIEVWHQVGDGSHLFDFMDKQVWKKYYNITNVIVRLSSGEDSKANALLLNAHLDSTLPSPGAADDLVGVAIMLETLRVMAMSPRPLTNSVVFLFNGAEESLQDASHLFITQHPLRKTIRSVINLEACGVGGPEIVFQATSDEMIRALGKMPRPYSSVIATEVFGSGLVLSDTDFRQFAQYGNLTGLDMALVQNSYLYHTQSDIPEKIEPGALQHFGENTLALCEYLTSNETTMGNSPDAKPLARIVTGSTIYFSGLGGYLFVVYTREQATLLYGALVSLVAIIVSSRVDWNRKGVYLLGALGVGTSLLAAILSANFAAYITGTVMNKSLTWFRHEAFPILLYGPPATAGALLTQRVIASFVRTPNASPELVAVESSLLEHSALVGQIVHYSIALMVGHAVGLGSSYLFALSILAALSAVLLNDFVLCRGGERRVHLASYFIGQISPLLLGIEGLVGFLDLFVPLTGRIGDEAPVDFIIASLVCGVGFLSIPMILPFSHRYGKIFTSRMIIVLVFFTAGTTGWFTRPRWNVYDVDHPKRLLVLHLENITTTPSVFDLHIASVDPVPFYDVVLTATTGLGVNGVLPERMDACDQRPDWDIIFPVSQFLVSYKIPLPTTVSVESLHPWSESFQVTATRSILNAVLRTRYLEIVMTHPNIIWPVVAFVADVVSWDLPESPERGLIRHHVKSVAANNVARFSLALTIQLSPEQFEAAMREDQREKEQRGDVSEKDQILGGLKVDFSGLDKNGMFPASSRHPSSGPGMSFFKQLNERLPKYCDAVLVSAIAGVAYI